MSTHKARRKAKAKAKPTGQIVSRRATREDIIGFSSVIKWPTAKAWVAEMDGEVLALGGFALCKGRWIGFLDFTKNGRDVLNRNVCAQVKLLRVVKDSLQEAKEQGVKFIYADAATEEHPRAAEFLERFGFHIDPRSQAFYRWKPS
jgi:hypothetical protein